MTTKTPTNKQYRDLRHKMKQDYNLDLAEADVYIVRGTVYICTTKTAELFKTKVHNFSNQYPTPLMDSGVRRIKLGRTKYYCLNEVLKRLTFSIEKGKSIFEICELMKLNKIKAKKKSARKRKNNGKT